MNTDELRERLGRHPERVKETQVVVQIDKPSVGPIATAKIENASYGFDWESGLFILHPKASLVVKTEREELWDRAYSFLYDLSTQETYKGNPTSLAKRAKAILEFGKKINQPADGDE